MQTYKGYDSNTYLPTRRAAPTPDLALARWMRETDALLERVEREQRRWAREDAARAARRSK